MDQLVAIFLGSTLGTAIARFGFDLIFNRKRRSKELPYKWTCEDQSCKTKFTSSHLLVLDRLRTDHMLIHGNRIASPPIAVDEVVSYDHPPTDFQG